jgi:two-component system, chemotaxis family, chemotaxis protein CheY
MTKRHPQHHSNRSDSPAHAGPAQRDTGPFSPCAMHCTALIVDDSGSARSVMREIVREAGLRDDRIYEAANGQEALALLEEVWIDLILLDINMPVMNGEVFARTLRAREDLDDVRMLVVTAEHSPFRHARLRHLGVDWILTKPFYADHLRDAIRVCLPGAESIGRSSAA